METIKTKLKPNPRDTANILSILFFAWTIPLFKQSSAKSLEIEDICQPRKCDQSKLLGEKLEKYSKFVHLFYFILNYLISFL